MEGEKGTTFVPLQGTDYKAYVRTNSTTFLLDRSLASKYRYRSPKLS
jgi:hypothetical protein